MTATLYAALAKAQANFKPIGKNRSVQIRMKTGGSFAFKYADLEAIIAATRPALSAEGLAVIQPLMSDPATGAMWIETRLVHADGGELVSRLDLKPAATYGDPKDFGAAVTYLRRYALSALLGVSADDDLDSKPEERQADEPAAPPELLAAASKAAQQGIDAYSAFWKTITKDERTALTPYHASMKAQAYEVAQ